ncbi:MAG: hypothetical protein O3B86_02615 [Planctomycetota bacterium]|nr:hypothetical protein [Planctomycetota bacterium]
MLSDNRSAGFVVWMVVVLATIWPADVYGQSKVVVESNGRTHRLLRNGEPYINGAGGDSYLAELAAVGGNSIRTWSTEKLDVILDEAHKHKLTVCVGLWLGHERHGFDYQDEISVGKQLDACMSAVRKYKDHPAADVGCRQRDGRRWHKSSHLVRRRPYCS